MDESEMGDEGLLLLDRDGEVGDEDLFVLGDDTINPDDLGLTEKIAEARRKFRKLEPSADAPSSLSTTSAPQRARKVPTIPQKKNPSTKLPEEHIEKLSGLNVRGWKVLPTLIEEVVITGYPYCKLANSLNTSQPFVTVGVIVEKTQSRTTSNNQSKYMIWKMSNLAKTKISLFLFGDCYESHWKEAEGSVIGIIGATSAKEGTLTVNQSNQIVLLGTSVDCGVCIATRKDGKPCSAHINISVTKYCEYHLMGAYRSIKAKENTTAASLKPNHHNPKPNHYKKPKTLISKIVEGSVNPAARLKSAPATMTAPPGYAYTSPVQSAVSRFNLTNTKEAVVQSTTNTNLFNSIVIEAQNTALNPQIVNESINIQDAISPKKVGASGNQGLDTATPRLSSPVKLIHVATSIDNKTTIGFPTFLPPNLKRFSTGIAQPTLHKSVALFSPIDLNLQKNTKNSESKLISNLQAKLSYVQSGSHTTQNPNLININAKVMDRSGPTTSITQPLPNEYTLVTPISSQNQFQIQNHTPQKSNLIDKNTPKSSLAIGTTPFSHNSRSPLNSTNITTTISTTPLPYHNSIIPSNSQTPMERAIAIIKVRGGIKPEDTTPILPPKLQQIKPLKNLQQEKDASFKERVAAVFGKVDLDSVEGKAILAKESAHSELSGTAEYVRQFRFDMFEQHDQILDNMQKIKELTIKQVVYCPLCKYTAEGRSKLCISLAHKVQYLRDVKKRFFRCKHCKYRNVAYGVLFPSTPCGRCHGTEYHQVSLADFNGLLSNKTDVFEDKFMPVLSVNRDGSAHVEKPEATD